MEGSYFTLLWISDGDIMNPKGLIGMTEEKAIGSIKWTRTVLGKNSRCCIYDPEFDTIFNQDRSYNWTNIVRLEKETKIRCGA